jgi:hypothetical protein
MGNGARTWRVICGGWGGGERERCVGVGVGGTGGEKEMWRKGFWDDVKEEMARAGSRKDKSGL